jgi:N-methylhydantoinase B
MEAMLEAYGDALHPEDVIILNDPYQGGMHLPDVFMFKPIFHDGRLVAHAVVIAHHCDMGGRVPGSNAADSTEIYQEGLRVPPLKLYREGVPDEALFTLIRRNVRVPDLVVGDLDAQLATCVMGESEVLELIERYGAQTLDTFFDELIQYGETLTRKCLQDWPDGQYTFTDYIDDDGLGSESIAIRCTLTVAGDHISADFAGSAPQVRGAISCAMSWHRWRPAHSPATALRTRSWARWPGSSRGARSPPGKAPTPSSASAAGTRRPGSPSSWWSTVNGAWGARPDKDGIEGITNPAQNMSNMPVETLGYRYPIRVEEYAFRPDSCGADRWRGGLGLIRQYRFLGDETTPQLRADRARHRPYGLQAGGEAAPSVNILNPGTAGEETLPSKVTRQIHIGDVLRHEQPGGGGFGDPARRGKAALQRDLDDGRISGDYARRWHGE